MGVNQSDRQASIRAVTATALDYDGDWSARFDAAAIPAGDFNGRLLAWINIKLTASFTNLPSAQAALAASASAPDWNGLGTFSAV